MLCEVTGIYWVLDICLRKGFKIWVLKQNTDLDFCKEILWLRFKQFHNMLWVFIYVILLFG